MARRKAVLQARTRRKGQTRQRGAVLYASDPLYAPVATLVEQTQEPLRRAILTRFLRAAGAAIGQATPTTLTKAASADSDLTAVPILVKPITYSGFKPITWSGKYRSPSLADSDHSV